MHSSSFEADRDYLRNEGEVLVAIAALVTEGRIPGKINKSRGFYEGPHCPLIRTPPSVHNCDPGDVLCQKYETIQRQVLNLWRKNIPVCVEVFLTPSCSCENVHSIQDSTSEAVAGGLLLEQWYFTVNQHRISDTSSPFSINQLISAVRSQLYFSQISAWLSPSQDENSAVKLTSKNFKYRLAIPGETFESFTVPVNTHNFPAADLGNGLTLTVSLLSLPRMSILPDVKCPKCEPPLYVNPKMKLDLEHEMNLLDDRMHINCTQKGKHRCEDVDDFYNVLTKDYNKLSKLKRVCNKSNNVESNGTTQNSCEPSTSDQKLHLDISKTGLYHVLNENRKTVFKNFEQKNEKRNSSPNCTRQVMKNSKLEECVISRFELQKKIDLVQNKDILNIRFRNCGIQNDDNQQIDKQNSTNNKTGYCEKLCDVKCVHNDWTKTSVCLSDSICDSSCMNGDIIKNREKFSIYVDNCDSPQISHQKYKKMRDISNSSSYKGKARQRLTFEDYCEKDLKFKEAKKATSTVTKNDKQSINPSVEVPSPVEQAKFRKSLDSAASMVFHSRTGLPLTSSPAPVRRGKCFDFDSSINSVSAIKSALFSASFSTDEDSESDGSIVSPCSPDTFVLPQREPPPTKYNRKGHSSNLLGSFEESVLNGRLEPVSTVHGFTAELGASGSFVPGHMLVPVTVFFYTLGDNDKVSSPYLGHINLGKKGYNVPKIGTVQVTLFNPLGTVVKMFVIMYDLADMPPNSQTFIRQRTLYMPTNCQDKNLEWGPKWLRYLIHLRFMSSKSGRIYLHSDIRMIIFRKSDLDTATAHGLDMSYELRSFTHMPANPKYSPRK